MRYVSVCSGIEAATVAWHGLGWEPVAFCEVEPFPSAVLKHHYPDVPNLGDMTMLPNIIRRGELDAPDLLVGGTPCQAFSVAGLRNSLEDNRGQLTISFIGIADAIDDVRLARGEHPCIVVWENVPGVLNTKDNAFGCFLAGLAGESGELQPAGGKWSNAGCVFGPKRAVAWRVLDAQHFGVAQRRRRVFVVASARDGFNPAKVLFEFEGVRRDTAPSREARESVAGTIAARFGISRNKHEECVAATLQARMGSGGVDADTETLVPSVAGTLDTQCGSSEGCATAAIAFAQNQLGEVRTGEVLNTLNTNSNASGRNTPVVMQPVGAFFAGQGAKAGSIAYSENVSPTLKASDSGTNRTPSAHIAMQVRRLTPTECERLQGFPDGYTNIPWRNKPEAPDGPRYKALGNSMAVPCMEWIGRRIESFARSE